MLITMLRSPMAKILEQRCFYLFLALLALMIAVPFVAETAHGPIILLVINVTILLAAIAAVGRSRSSFVIAVVLVVPSIVFRILALGSSLPGYLTLTWGCNAVFYAYILANLLHYVLRRDFMTSD